MFEDYKCVIYAHYIRIFLKSKKSKQMIDVYFRPKNIVKIKKKIDDSAPF